MTKQYNTLYAIIDTVEKVYWHSNNHARTSWDTPGTAKIAWSHGANHKMKCKFDDQTRYKLVTLPIPDLYL